MLHRFLSLRLVITSAICSRTWRAIRVTYLHFPFWEFNWRSGPLFYLSLLWVLYWTYWLLMVLAAVSSQLTFWTIFAAASSGSVNLRFLSVMELSICARYVNCSSDLFVISSNLAFWVWSIFYIFSKRYLIKLEIKLKLLTNFLLSKVGVQKLFRFTYVPVL